MHIKVNGPVVAVEKCASVAVRIEPADGNFDGSKGVLESQKVVQSCSVTVSLPAG